MNFIGVPRCVVDSCVREPQPKAQSNALIELRAALEVVAPGLAQTLWTRITRMERNEPRGATARQCTSPDELFLWNCRSAWILPASRAAVPKKTSPGLVARCFSSQHRFDPSTPCDPCPNCWGRLARGTTSPGSTGRGRSRANQISLNPRESSPASVALSPCRLRTHRHTVRQATALRTTRRARGRQAPRSPRRSRALVIRNRAPSHRG
jgi:hypothetical protein